MSELAVRGQTDSTTRALTWRGLAWVVTRQHRATLFGCSALYTIVALLVAANGAQMRGSYRQFGLAGCTSSSRTLACAAGTAEFTQAYVVWVDVIPLLLLAVPMLAGAFAGGPVLGRDLDRGTFRFAWTQGAGRARLLTAKLVLLGGPLVLAGVGIAALATWWFAPLYALGHVRLIPQTFVSLGPAFAGWTLLSFALGVACGAALRRVIPAIATALAVGTALAVVTGIWLRYYLYRAPLRFTAVIAPVTTGSPGQVGLPTRVLRRGGPPPHADVMNGWWVGADGRVLQLVQAGRHEPLAPLVLRGAHLVSIYQPDSRFWPFQWAETGWLAVLSALLLAAAFSLSRRPHPLGIVAGRRAQAGYPEPAAGLVPGPSAGLPLRRTLSWLGLVWVAGRQHRTALLGCAALFAAAALLLVANGLAMRGFYRQLGLNDCHMQHLTPLCATSLAQFKQDFGIWAGLVPLLLMLVPVSAGAFTGAAVVARDLERGTFRFSWTQGCGRLRLLVVKVAVLAVAVLVGSGAVGALAQWWFAPLYTLGYARLNGQYFAIQGPAFAAWALLAFAIAVLAGSLLHRGVAAIASTLAVYAALAVPAGIVLRYRFYRPSVQVTAGLGTTSLSLPPRSVLTGTWWTGPGGTVIPQAQIAHALTTLKSTLALAHWFGTHDARLAVTYQPDTRFWGFQWTETAWLVAVSGLLLATAFVLARDRTRRRSAAAWLPLAAAALACATCAGGFSLAAADSARQAGASAQTPTAAPAAPAQDLNGPGYLALGDSVAFGYRPTSVTPAADYLDPADFTGYPEDLASMLGLHLVNASCPGETTSSLINQAAPSNGCETSAGGSPGYRGLAPLHVSYSGSQLSYAVRYLTQHPHTELVTIDVGANDMFLCQQSAADHCTGPDFDRTLAAVTKNLDTILSALRDQAHYRNTLVVLTYYALNYSDRMSVSQTEALNQALAGPAARYGARTAGGYTAFRAASARVGGSACAAGLVIPLSSGGCDQHPSASGQRVLATAVQDAIRPHAR